MAGSATGVVRLAETRCWELLRTHRHLLGRVGFVEGNRAAIRPVNYRLHHRGLVFRTAVGSTLAGLPDGTAVTFQVDDVDAHWREGWSVIAEGTVEVPGEELRAELEQLGLEPWAPGEHHEYRRVRIDDVSGRRID
ncbi:pyridoxamine 5'-phosphate oxidase family protein [Egibacter rhizosphaerae]|uniref:Pyridoxamine 5'-phosphate oxidase family protein n=1 Tax=Egibacter rhizosphaerae TaxID=1670831 RepID=A0A411YGH0_9ACTN|nr:pyridoxamine 5'-phosphate oxidase family protein [Egibacter rhizosphaerae]QBI20354.1 pyridoxamine 5'-phosphate oxidase family protein [Egibacter rhizosphaerae]